MIERKGQRLGSVLVDREVEPSAGPASEPEERADGVYSGGGGWHEIVIDGDVIDKVRGADAAQAAYEVYQQANEPIQEDDDGDDDTHA